MAEDNTQIGMKLIGVKVPTDQIEALDELSRRERFPNRGEAIRVAIRDPIREIDGKY